MSFTAFLFALSVVASLVLASLLFSPKKDVAQTRWPLQVIAVAAIAAALVALGFSMLG